MKFIISAILVTITLLVTACVPETDIRQQVLSNAHVIKRDGCEYLVMYFDRSMSVTHKGDCSNPIHRQPADLRTP